MLRALVSYYDQLIREHPEEVAPLGWCTARVSFVLQLDSAGELVAAIPIEDRRERMKVVPMQGKRAVNIAANFLCDNSSYILGCDLKGKPDRTSKCFQASKALHHEVLDGVAGICARAILQFFDTWMPSAETLAAKGIDDAILAGGGIVFSIKTANGLLDPFDDEAIRNAWDAHLAKSKGSDVMRCLVTGEIAPVARLHPSIKGVYGAQSSGASLVSFNAPAFESYGHDGEQGRNAPVSESAAQSYALALNYLLSKPRHHIRLGDTTVVYWSDHGDEGNARAFGAAMGGFFDEGAGDCDPDALIDGTMRAIARGDYRDLDGVEPESTFYLLGIAPSAARLVVKFFLRDSFGAMLTNLGKHYRRSDIAHGPGQRAYLTPYQLLREVENPKAAAPTVAPVLAGPLLTSMLQDAPYPQALYVNALLRIHATQANPDEHVRKVTRGRAAILRAYLIRNCKREGYDERSLTVGLNQSRNEAAYNLGRAFAILEQIQEEANGKATLTNRYYNAASTTPLTVFPALIRLSKAHLAKIERSNPRHAGYLERQLREALGEERVYVFPKRLTLEEQGDFALGDYHQTSKRYERKSDATVMNDEVNEEE